MEIWVCPVCWAHPAEPCLELLPPAAAEPAVALGCSGQTGKGPVCHTPGAGAVSSWLCSLPARLAALQRFPITFGTFSVTLGCGGTLVLRGPIGIEQSCTLHRAWGTVALAQHPGQLCSRDRAPGQGAVLCLGIRVRRAGKDPLAPCGLKAAPQSPWSCLSPGGSVFVSGNRLLCCRRGLDPGTGRALSGALPQPGPFRAACSAQGRNQLVLGGVWFGCAGFLKPLPLETAGGEAGRGAEQGGVSGGSVGAVSPARPC